jgi:uncharacterized membrane protein
MQGFTDYIELIGRVIEAVGVGVMVLGAVVATGWFAVVVAKRGVEVGYHSYRRVLGRAILLGLEFLVAGDIIRTVAVTPTITSVVVLAVIVLIRTFLSMALELELDGRWPWQRGRTESGM